MSIIIMQVAGRSYRLVHESRLNWTIIAFDCVYQAKTISIKYFARGLTKIENLT